VDACIKVFYSKTILPRKISVQNVWLLMYSAVRMHNADFAEKFYADFAEKF